MATRDLGHRFPSEEARIVRGAIESVLESWTEERDSSPSRDEVESALLGIEEVLGEPDDEHDRGDPAGSDRLLEARLLEALRMEVLRRWSAQARSEHAGAYMQVLCLLEKRRGDALPEDARDLSARLAEPDAFELLVEVAHDIRSPLTSVLFLAETLQGGHSGKVSELQHSQLGLIYSASLGMISVVSDVMELARRGVGLFEASPVPFSLAAVFNSLDQMLRPMAAAKNIDLRWTLPGHDRVSGHAMALSRVLMNLATNGLKFTEEGFVEVAAVNTGRSTVEFSVRDTGRGIDAEKQTRLFDAFRPSLSRRKPVFSGSGLGLSIARRLLRQMGSDLQFETRRGWGTRFHFVVELPPVRDL